MIRVKRLAKSFTYAFKGLHKVYREEQNIRILFAVALGAVILAAYLRISRIEWCVLIFSLTLPILMETINSAVERVADVLKPRIDRYVKEVKDIMAAAVLLASLATLIIGTVIFLPYLLGGS
ncbi:MAG: diacylglycerol kinase family protein [Patescibacteria group bacterium]|jgi:diacylglycerol kinase